LQQILFEKDRSSSFSVEEMQTENQTDRDYKNYAMPRRLFRESDPSAEGGQKIIIERIVVEIRLIQKPFGMIDKIE
jgi:hypothetical protein